MITGSYKNIFSVIRNFPNCLLFCIPTKKNESSCGSTSSPAVRGVSVPDFGLSNRCVVELSDFNSDVYYLKKKELLNVKLIGGL